MVTLTCLKLNEEEETRLEISHWETIRETRRESVVIWTHREAAVSDACCWLRVCAAQRHTVWHLNCRQPRVYSRSCPWLSTVLITCLRGAVGRKREREKEKKKKKRKIRLFSEIMFNVEIWLILKCNLQFSSILFLKENISCSRGRSSKQSLITSLPMSGPLAFTMYYRIDNANFGMMPSPHLHPLWLKDLGKIPIIWINLALDGAGQADISCTMENIVLPHVQE